MKMDLWSTPPPADARRFLGSLELLQSLNDGSLDALTPELEWVRCPGGTNLFWQGDPGDAMYFVYSGRLRVSVRQGVENRILAEIGRGEPIGEIALLTQDGRSASVRAIRDCQLVRLSRESFERMLETNPRAALPLSKVVADRLLKSRRAQAFRSAVSTIALIPLGKTGSTDFISNLIRRLSAREKVLHVTQDLVVRELGLMPDATAVTRWLDRQEALHRLLLLEVDPNHKNADLWLRQADRAVFVADSQAAAGIGAARPILAQMASSGTALSEELVLLHDSSEVRPSSSWIAARSFFAHHHLRRGRPEDLERLVRWTLGRSVGLVLGGAGARTFAAIGAIRAMQEAGIPIDRVGGSSLGAVVAAQLAAGWDAHRMLDENRRSWGRAFSGRNGSLSLVRSSMEESVTGMLESMFGEAQIEDLPVSFFGTVVNLTTEALIAKQRGPVVKWLRAATAAPGISLPIAGDEGDLNVDACVVNNLPADIMRERGEGPIVAVKVSQSRGLRADAHADGGSLFRFLGRRNGSGMPDMTRILHRIADVTSRPAERQARSMTDVFIEPALEKFGSMDFDRADEIERIGYESAKPLVQDLRASLKGLL